ncbi:MAG: Ni/Fe-hydrogenase cytochrome b subunit [Pirellulales bacterium]|nr:Ni/Fe-hydrogenase cytochrome b subunit [Pirellulales bacterium]
MAHEQVKGRFASRGSGILLLVMGAGAVAAFLRYAMGLGATTNLSDAYPWGLWIGVDVMSGVALAAGGFTTAALVYLCGGRKYHALVRPAVLTGLLGYVFVGIGLLVDLALPWHIWHAIIYWPEHSVMFEVAWCVMLYLSVLALEFAPPVCERFGWSRLHALWRVVSPLLAIAAVTFFVYLMSHSLSWTLVTAVFFLGLTAVLAGAPGRPGVPVMLIIAGVVFSTMHQSSLGSLFLLMPDKLDPLWWTPALSINFLLSAIAVGFAMVIFEATFSAKVFKRPVEKEALAGLGVMLCWALWIYLAFRLTDLAARGQLAGAVGGPSSDLFLAEIVLGVVVPALMLMNTRVRENTGGRFLAATLAVLGVVFNRMNVAWLAITVPGEETYVPSAVEVLITISIIAALMFFFTLAVKIFPVFAREGEQAPA